MSPILLFVLFGIVFVLIALASIYFSKKNKIKRQLAKIPLRRGTNLRQNEISKLHGKALHVKEPLIASYSQRKCIFYQIKIQQKVSSGKNRRWKTLIDEECVQEFFLESEGEMVIVKPSTNPANYSCYLVKDRKVQSGTFNDASSRFEALLNAYNIKSTGWLGFNKTLKYEEGVIEIGEYITVAGKVNWKSLKEPIPEYPYSKIAALESTDSQKIIITDLPETFPLNKRK